MKHVSSPGCSSAYDSVPGICVKQALFACIAQSDVTGGACYLNPVRKKISMVGNHAPHTVLAAKHGILPCCLFNANTFTVVHDTFLNSLHDRHVTVDDSVVVYLLYVTAPGPVLSGLSSHSTLRPTRGGDHLPLTCRRHPQRGNRHRRTAPGLHLTWRSVQCTMPCWQQAQLLVVSWHSSFLFCDRSERIATSLLLLFRYERRYSMMKEIPKQHFLPSKSPAHLQTFSVASPWWDCCTYSWM